MLLDRETVCARLRMSKWASYQASNGLRPGVMRMLRSRDVVDMLNRAARGGQKLLDGDVVPDALTADEVSEETGVPARRILLATRRTRNPLPCWRINSHTVRFDRSSVMDWLGL